jgi:hypothetical protein
MAAFGRSKTARDGHTGDCRPCRKIRLDGWRRTERGKELMRANDLKRILARSNTTVAWYNEQYAKQEGRCMICQKPYPTLCADHCHEVGAPRALLCRRCNFAIGFLRDDPEAAHRAAKYLQGWRALRISNLVGKMDIRSLIAQWEKMPHV